MNVSEDLLQHDDAPVVSWILWAPAGLHRITAVNGYDGHVMVDERAAELILTDYRLARFNDLPVWADFSHEGKEAAGWVCGFRWDAAHGIFALIEWTEAGERAIRGRNFTRFSPAFDVDRETLRPTRLPARGNACGSLVNAPAFGAAMPRIELPPRIRERSTRESEVGHDQL